MMIKSIPDCESVWKEYLKGLGYNAQQGLNDTVQTNEDFFIGNQWKGVEAGGLPTPVFNFLKRVVLFTVAGITSNNVKMQASAIGNNDGGSDLEVITDVVNKEFGALFEVNKIVNLLREFLRNAAVDGDACTYTYWNPEIDTGHPVKGAIMTEIIENTRVFFGDTSDRRVQRQPYIIISRRELLDALQDRAAGLGCVDTDSITADTDDGKNDTSEATEDKATVLLRLWRNKETKTIWGIETTKNTVIRKSWNTGLTNYPITWLCWDYIHDSYHGQAMITGLIPNQIFINKLFAMSMISLMTTAYPKIIYDKNSQVSKLLSVAESYVGYLEKKSIAQLEDFTANAGSGNFTVFGQWYGMNAVPWCAEFISFCADKAGIPVTIIPKHASCSVGVAWFQKTGRWHKPAGYVPKPGDIVYFTENGVTASHVGIVSSTDTACVYTVEGNTGTAKDKEGNDLVVANGGGVAQKCYPLSSKYILGYGNPAYMEDTSQPDAATARRALVDTAAKKLGLNSPEYWYNVLSGTTTADCKYIEALFKKIAAT